MSTLQNNSKSFFKEYYFVIIPILVTFGIYFISLFFGFRNFDEDIIIKDFYTKKTFLEYFERYLLLDLNGITEASGFAFSNIQNVHFCILERPIFYLVNYLFQSKAFLFHSWGLLLHIIALSFFSLFCYGLSSKKNIALFAGLIWTLHPTNVESIIWATNWPAILGFALYFYTLSTILGLLKKDKVENTHLLFVFLITTIQILIVEHTITLPVMIFLSAFYFLKHFHKDSTFKPLQTSLRLTLPALFVTSVYCITRVLVISNNTAIQSNVFERIFFLTPQTLFHQLKLIVFPNILSIDQIEHVILDKAFFGPYHLFSLFFLVCLLVFAFILRNKSPYLSFGILGFIVAISPFVQIIPLYSLCAERYNYLASAFLIFGIIAFIFNIRNKSPIALSLILCFTLGGRTLIRIFDWKDSESLFLSTITTSKTPFKKGIWTYNLALSKEGKREKLIYQSINYLKQYTENRPSENNLPILKTYGLDQNSLLTKADLRLATNYELLGNKELQLKHLQKALDLSTPDSYLRSSAHKNLGTYYFQRGEYKTAIDYYTKSNVVFYNPSVDFAIAACYLNLKDLLNYEKYLKQSITNNVSNGKPFQAYGQLLEIEKKDYLGAIKNYKIATILEDSPQPYILLATLHLKLSQLNKGLKVLKNGLHNFPDNPSLLYLNGTALISKGKKDEGIKNLKKVINNANTPDEIKTEALNIIQKMSS